jgi:hypothetical protein
VPRTPPGRSQACRRGNEDFEYGRHSRRRKPNGIREGLRSRSVTLREGVVASRQCHGGGSRRARQDHDYVGAQAFAICLRTASLAPSPTATITMSR